MSQLEDFFVAAQVSSPGLFGGLEGSTDLKVGTLSRGHLGQSPSHRKEAKKFLRAEYLDSAANYQIFTHFIIRVPQEHLTWGNCAIPRGCDQRGTQAASGHLGYDRPALGLGPFLVKACPPAPCLGSV